MCCMFFMFHELLLVVDMFSVVSINHEKSGCFVPVKRLAVKIVYEMTCYVLSWMENPTRLNSATTEKCELLNSAMADNLEIPWWSFCHIFLLQCFCHKVGVKWFLFKLSALDLKMYYHLAYVVNVTFRHVIILGDINTSHRRIDHCCPDADPVSTEGVIKLSANW